jgi:hypothetical protein
MYTAYCIHVSEGVPVRRIVETKVQDKFLIVTSRDCDWSWDPRSTERTQVVPLPRATLFTSGGEECYHRQFRKQMVSEHSWRFEIYWPLSTLGI